jgi:hypothetical protein
MIDVRQFSSSPKSLKQLTEEAIAANDGALFAKALDFVGREMKRLCFELVDFDGDIVSTVGEIEPFTVPVWHGKTNPLFRRSASLHSICWKRGASTVRRTHGRVIRNNSTN